MLIGLKVREETDVRTDGQTDTTDFVTRLAYAIGKIIQRIKKIFFITTSLSGTLKQRTEQYCCIDRILFEETSRSIC